MFASSCADEAGLDPDNPQMRLVTVKAKTAVTKTVLSYDDTEKKMAGMLKKVETFPAGTFTIDTSMDYNQMISALRKTNTSLAVVRVTIPEGYNLKDICALLVEKNVVKEDAFWEVANNYDFSHYFLEETHNVKMSDKTHISLFGKLNSNFQSRHLLQNSLRHNQNTAYDSSELLSRSWHCSTHVLRTL